MIRKKIEDELNNDELIYDLLTDHYLSSRRTLMVLR